MIDVCPEALAGTRIELLADGEGGSYCDRCGASLELVRATQRMVAADWTAGGVGYRKPRPGERTRHRQSWEER